MPAGKLRRSKPRRRQRVDPFANPVDTAEAASLRYVNDRSAGIRRRRSGTGFTYTTPDGQRLQDRDTLGRIRALAIPPAWTDVWICPAPSGHLQATGRDARGRKQYRYHKRWHEVRDESKYGRLLSFGRTLPRIRRRIRSDLARPGLPREKILAMVVRLLERTLIRVGNEEYARANKSFGLTTLRDRHIAVDGARIQFDFSGKSGKDHSIELTDLRLARLVKRCRDLPGQDLFQYIDDAGDPQPVTSADVNEYLREIAGEDFTAKDFRTWAGTLLAASRLAAFPGIESEVATKAAISDAIAAVAKRLGNTAAISRKSYIHPTVLDTYGDEKLFAAWTEARATKTPTPGLSREESALLRFLDPGQNTSSK